MEPITIISSTFALLVGFPAFLAAAINLAKVFGLADGLAAKVSSAVIFAAFVLVGIAVLTGNMELALQVDRELGVIAPILVMFTAFVVEFGLTKLFHNALRGAPFIGYSHSQKE